MGERERIGGEIAVGYLTSETLLDPGRRYRAEEGAELHADAEAIVVLGSDVDPSAGATEVAAAIARYGGALEIVDLAPLRGEPDSVVIANVFHRAVTFAEFPSAPPPDLEVALSLGGQERAAARWPPDLIDRISRAAQVLDPLGERLRAGDRIITGSIVQIPIDTSREVVADFGDLLAVRLEIDQAGPSR
jgi:2-keto-4-pentenoate hydratase